MSIPSPDYNSKTDTEKLVDYAFYAIQRGEAGHRRGAFHKIYKDMHGINTTGYGTVTDPGYNHLNYNEAYTSEEKAVELAKIVMAEKINEKCRFHFKDFDDLAPCYKALILDMAYHGSWPKIKKIMNSGHYEDLLEVAGDNPNIERSHVRTRMVEIGLVTQNLAEKYPDFNPHRVAQMLAQNMVKKYKDLNGTDAELTKDELALLYRTCLHEYGISVPEEQITNFALSFENVASGTSCIGSDKMATYFTGNVPQSTKRSSTIDDNDYVRPTHTRSSYQFTNRTPTLRATYKPKQSFEPDSTALLISREFTSPNINSRGGETPEMIVIHRTDSPSLSSTINTFQNRSCKTSAHYVIARDGMIYQMVAESDRANHAGKSYRMVNGVEHIGVNSNSIGIEIQCAPDEDFTPEQIASVSALSKDIAERHNIKKEDIIGHEDVSGSRKGGDPGERFPWNALRAQGIIDEALRFDENAKKVPANLVSVTANDCLYYKEQPETRVAKMDKLTKINLENNLLDMRIASDEKLKDHLQTKDEPVQEAVKQEKESTLSSVADKVVPTTSKTLGENAQVTSDITPTTPEKGNELA